MLNGLLSKLLSRYPKLGFLYQAPTNKAVKQTIDWNDITTPASIITLAGLLLSIYGAFQLNTVHGLVLVAIGRGLDLIDGPVSRLTRPTRFGAAFDATSDKIALLAILIACFTYDIQPIWLVAYVAIHNLLNSVLSVVAEKRGNNPEASLDGKLSMFFENIALGLAILSLSLHNPGLQAWAVVSIILSLPLGFMASISYFKAATGKHK
jgi:phosphatidylglycerophosphate synthase